MFPTQNPTFPKEPSRLSSVFGDFDSPQPKPPVPTCGPPSMLGGNTGFPHHFIDTGAKMWFLYIFWVFSGKTDADLLARIPDSDLDSNGQKGNPPPMTFWYMTKVNKTIIGKVITINVFDHIMTDEKVYIKCLN